MQNMLTIYLSSLGNGKIGEIRYMSFRQFTFETVHGFFIVLTILLVTNLFGGIVNDHSPKKILIDSGGYIVFFIVTAILNKLFPSFDIIGENMFVYFIFSFAIIGFARYYLYDKFY